MVIVKRFEELLNVFGETLGDYVYARDTDVRVNWKNLRQHFLLTIHSHSSSSFLFDSEYFADSQYNLYAW